MADRTLEYVPVRDLRGHDSNPKDHDQALLAESMGRFGFTEPGLMDERTGLLVAGHGRLERLVDDEAAGREPPDGVRVDGDGRWWAPVVRGWSSVDDGEARAYLVTSNRLVETGGWLNASLAPLLDDLRRNAEQGLEGVGFSNADVDAMLAASVAPDEPEPDDDVDRPPPQKRAKPADLWLLGDHRLVVGDCRVPATVDRLMDGVEVNVAVTSPPYADRRKYDEATEFRPIPPEQYVEWFAPVAANVAAHLASDGSWFVNIKAGVTPDGTATELYVLDLVLAHARTWGWNLATEFCWERVGVPKSVTQRFKNQFESVYQFARGPWKMRPDAVRHYSHDVPVAGGDGVGDTAWDGSGGAVDAQGTAGGALFGAKKRRNGTTELPSDVQGVAHDAGEWIAPGMAYPGNRLPTFSGTHEATGHSAAFPVGLPAWFVRAYSDEGDAVLDPFAGSGSTLLAAEQERRRGFGVEVSPLYVDVILDRWERHGGVKPKREPRRR